MNQREHKEQEAVWGVARVCTYAGERQKKEAIVETLSASVGLTKVCACSSITE